MEGTGLYEVSGLFGDRFFHLIKTISRLVAFNETNRKIMNIYWQKWIEVLKNAGIPGWKIEAPDDDIHVEMPQVTDLKLIRDNLPATPGAISLDINEPKERLKFIFHNGRENFEYILNPAGDDLDKE
jgi:hypothetical protein